MTDNRQPQISNLDFMGDLNQKTEEFVKDKLKEMNFAPETSDPVDDKGNLVDQTKIPVSDKFVHAISQQQAVDDRQQRISKLRSSVMSLTIEFGNYVDERVLKSARSVMTGPLHPYHYTWVPDQGKYGGDTIGSRYLTEADNQHIEGLIYMGYRRADFRQLEHLYVQGREAVMLIVPRSRHVIQSLVAKRVPPPPPLPMALADKFGTVMPPIVQSDGTNWIGGQCLYVVEREIQDQNFKHYQQLANGINRHQSDASRGIFLEPESQAARYDIELDNITGRR